MANKFVYVTEEIVSKDGIIPALSIGILETVDGDHYGINFVVGNTVMKVRKDIIKHFNPFEVGDLFPNKVCNVCHRYLPTTKFSKNQNN